MKLLSKILLISILLFNPLVAEEETIELNFINTPISQLTSLISQLTGNNFISTGEISGNFTFISQKPIAKKNLLSVYEMILRSKGYMIVNHKDKGFFMITRNNNPQRENIEFNVKGDNNEIKTEILYLKYFKPSKIKTIIEPYFTTAGKIVADDQLGFVLLTDYHDSIQKIKKIISKIDQPTALKIHWVKLNNVNVKNVFPQVKALAAILAKQYRKEINVIEDKASNSIIISCEGREYKAVEGVIQQIDSDSKLNLESNVVYLKNSKAADIVKIILDMEKTRYEKGSIKDSEKTSISSDVSSNSIIFMGDKSIINNYTEIIENLDKAKKQVYVEAKIIEINDEKAKELGVEFDDLLAAGGGKSGVWAVHGDLNKGLAPTLGLLSGTALDVTNVTGGLSMGVSLKLLESSGASEVLSSPKLLCLDNMESSIYVGKVTPIQQTQAISAVAGGTPYPASYSYKDIGLTLTVKPQIMTDNKVRLDISLKLEDIISNVDNLPETTKREIKTTSIVYNGNDIVIAGLLYNKTTNVKSKVPFLGDLPFLGALFRSDNKTSSVINLVVILTPTIINNALELPVESRKIEDKLELGLEEK